MNLTPSHHLGRTRTVPIRAGKFLLHYGLRSDFSDLYRTHAITNEAVIEQYGKALAEGYELLTSSEYGWASLPSGMECNVAIRDLGNGRFGLANPGTDSATLSGCYLALTSRPLEASLEHDACMRRTVAIHELVHLLQFPSPLYRSGERRSSAFIMDPNWWLHESVALAIEWFIGGASGKLLPHLWDWANSPHVSCQSDELGFQAFPWMVYLMETFGKNFPARLYQHDLSNAARNGGASEASDWLDGFIRSLNVEGKQTSLQSEFVRYACLWALPESRLPTWARQIVRVVGRPSWTEAEIVSDRKWRVRPIERLGFRIIPIPNELFTDSEWEMRVSHGGLSKSDVGSLHCAIVMIDDGDQAKTYEANSCDRSCLMRFSISSVTSIKEAFLMIANTCIGAGRGNHDLDAIEIELTRTSGN